MNKRLYRSHKEKMIGGVCGGLAEYFDIDPVFIRILFVVAVFAGGSGILAYIICWIVIPEQPYSTPVAPTAPASQQASPQPAPVTEPSNRKGSMYAGVILIIVGGLFLADNFLPHFHFSDFWPILMILLGIAILSRSTRHS
jgi:phage shock protein PspC (stress-responsive transcriptional regulator)